VLDCHPAADKAVSESETRNQVIDIVERYSERLSEAQKGCSGESGTVIAEVALSILCPFKEGLRFPPWRHSLGASQTLAHLSGSHGGTQSI
jgi:hypothetical protein